ncbi:MAG: DUF1015 domain-containing protein [Ruminococcaceae bacterium]|jgi:uncharacterized protein (DUF1015 family)|nr:DUF1015 domain-containing protein [Oscillospiraceae bacterium]
MSVIRPFKAIRPTKEYSSKVAALPYDVMSSEEAREMVKGNDFSFLHVDRGEIDLPVGTDIYSKEVYKKAKENLENLIKNRICVQDERPCLYIYRQIWKGRAQTGLVACASVDDYINNVIKKHEKTRADKEQDRINHVDTLDANTGPIFLTYRPNHSVRSIITDWISSHDTACDFISGEVKQTVWVIDDEKTIEKITELFESIPDLYIADGHHRCASAVRVAEMRRKANPDYTGNEEFNFFLSVLFPSDELRIMDYNRVIKDLNSFSKDEFLKAVGENFEIELKGKKAYSPVCQHNFGMYLDGEWYSLTSISGTFDENDAVDSLDVSILQNNLISKVLGIENPKTDSRIDFIGGIRGLSELEKRVNGGWAVAFSMYPTSLAELMRIADENELMPPKSTWFEPKLLSGLFIHKLS